MLNQHQETAGQTKVTTVLDTKCSRAKTNCHVSLPKIQLHAQPRTRTQAEKMLNQTHKLFPFQLKKAWTTSRASVHSSQLSKNNALNFPGASPETDLLELPALKIRKEDYSSADLLALVPTIQPSHRAATSSARKRGPLFLYSRHLPLEHSNQSHQPLQQNPQDASLEMHVPR